MKNKRISSKMEKMLNLQMTREAYQAQVYLSYGCWAEENSFAGVSDFLYKHYILSHNEGYVNRFCANVEFLKS